MPLRILNSKPINNIISLFKPKTKNAGREYHNQHNA